MTPVGNVLSVTDTINSIAGAVTGYAYDALNRTTQITQSATPGSVGGGVADKRADFAYNALGQFDSIERFSDLAGTSVVARSQYDYDALNRLESLTHRNTGGNAVSFFDFEYDDASRITAITDVDGRTDYDYDDKSQLIAG